jgi:sec-independent protein translocase protein TatB
MFGISFSELIIIAVIALIVIGPEKLPKVARVAGLFAGRMQKYVAQVKEEVNREVDFNELQQLQQEIKETVRKTKINIQSSLGNTTDAVKLEINDSEIKVVEQTTK